jgi:S-formylglutathione hydrolase
VPWGSCECLPHPSLLPTRALQCPWGQKAFSKYLGADRAAWAAYDPTHLILAYKGPELHIRIEQGTADSFFTQKQLHPEHFLAAAAAAKVPVNMQWREGYDHSYWFISTFIGEAIEAHALLLKA